LARSQQNRIKRLLPGKTLWLAIAAISCAAFGLLHVIFSSVPADALIANTGIAKTVDVTSAIASSIPMNFDVPKNFQAKTIKDTHLVNSEKVIALTFDDGPWPETTEQILATLKKENIKATFYMIGQPLKSFPEIGKKVLADGHVIANHTLHHWYHKMSPLVAQREIEDTAKIIKEVLNVETAYFRPPGGVLTNGLVAYAQKHNQSINMWSVDSGDSHPKRPTPEAMLKTILAQATPGGIVLMHDGGGSHINTAKALPQIIAKLRAQGYKFATVPELLELSSAPAEPPTASASPVTVDS
jgi:peptidoglycan-N-acetylglucosamine deacetylase